MIEPVWKPAALAGLEAGGPSRLEADAPDLCDSASQWGSSGEVYFCCLGLLQLTDQPVVSLLVATEDNHLMLLDKDVKQKLHDA